MGAMVATPAEHSAPSPDSLSEADVALLECERGHWGPGPGKEAVVRALCGVSLPAYYQRLYRLCHTPAAVQYDAALVRQILESADHVTAKRLEKTRPQSGGHRG